MAHVFNPNEARSVHGFSPFKSLKRVVDLLIELNTVARERHALAMMDERRLMDVGLSREDLERELRRPLWNSSLLRHAAKNR